MRGWQADKGWADQFLPEIKGILGQHLIAAAPVEEDQQRNTDLIVLRLEAVRVACRIRRLEQLERFGDEFTIRSSRPNGTLTELAKIIAGFGDYLFYGFGDESTGRLVQWFLGDLRIFRLWFNATIVNRRGEQPGVEIQNHDGSSEFRAFRIRELPTRFIVASTVYDGSQMSLVAP